ncbi:hypothetical protein PR048_011365 [Dryococelus australis]|uniref:DDE-1 domain-containing protein n=1 Tax=Dryococelus australis TaxID=614101 RepID=A0ABQ9HLD2_9NEOP|nr:hypothetical protein PR048_011365 [Dryococelus australis]
MSVPEDIDFSILQQPRGLRNEKCFFEYITNIFYKSLLRKEIPHPVILFTDGHTSPLNMQTSKFCREHGIVQVALLPNATHILQPMDIARFKKCVTPKIFESSFCLCGLYPWNPLVVGTQNLVLDSPMPISLATMGSPVSMITHVHAPQLLALQDNGNLEKKRTSFQSVYTAAGTLCMVSKWMSSCLNFGFSSTPLPNTQLQDNRNILKDSGSGSSNESQRSTPSRPSAHVSTTIPPSKFSTVPYTPTIPPPFKRACMWPGTAPPKVKKQLSKEQTPAVA